MKQLCGRPLRRLTALMLCLACLCACACAEEPALRGYDAGKGYVYVALGRYPQTKDGGVLPIVWRVLRVDGEKAYLCSEYILFAREMHASLTEYAKIGADFGQTELSAYLNGEFAQQAFTQDELAMLLPFQTFGKVFLLDSDDLKDKSIGMGENTNRKKSPGLRAWGTEYAVANGLFVYQKSNGSHSPYWVRNQSTADKRHGRCTKANGVLGHIESGRDNEGVRPAVYLDLSAFTVSGGSGLLDDPYVITPARSADPSDSSDPS